MDAETSTSVVSKGKGKVLTDGKESLGHPWEAGSEEGPGYTMQLNTERTGFKWLLELSVHMDLVSFRSATTSQHGSASPVTGTLAVNWFFRLIKSFIKKIWGLQCFSYIDSLNSYERLYCACL